MYVTNYKSQNSIYAISHLISRQLEGYCDCTACIVKQQYCSLRYDELLLHFCLSTHSELHLLFASSLFLQFNISIYGWIDGEIDGHMLIHSHILNLTFAFSQFFTVIKKYLMAN